MKLGYKVTTIINTFSVPNGQNSNEEEKNSITAKAYFKKSYFVDEIRKEPTDRPPEALLQLANHVSNHGDTNIVTRERQTHSIFTARDEDMIF